MSHALLIDVADILVIEFECEADAVAGFDIAFAVSDFVKDKATGYCAEGVGLDLSKILKGLVELELAGELHFGTLERVMVLWLATSSASN